MSYFYSEVEFCGKVKKLICRKDEEGLYWWLGQNEEDEYYLAWVAKGNTPEQWEPEELS
jgi:hypothetical protein